MFRKELNVFQNRLQTCGSILVFGKFTRSAVSNDNISPLYWLVLIGTLA